MSLRIPTLFLLAASILPAVWSNGALAESEETTAMQARLAACAPCHGEQGEGTSNAYFPRLAGKPDIYLYNQLIAFQNGKRRYPPMAHLLAFMPDAYLKAIAAFFASKRPDPPMAATPKIDQGALDHGRVLVTAGDIARGIPACTKCHGPAFSGMEPAIPGLLGLPADYISAQLGAWRYGTRTAHAPDCMQIVAGHLSEADVAAVAGWISSIQAEAGAAPLPSGTLKLPLACGSEPQ